MIFDYFSGKLSNSWRAPTPNEPMSYGSISVFVSHSHGDHYNPEIFSWIKDRSDIKYILSSDVKNVGAFFRKTPSLDVSFISDGESLEINGFTVKAYGSTDIGVSFHVSRDGLSIFHAGDLNYWHWSDESSQEEVKIEREKFDAEMCKIKNGVKNIDVAFFPVDPRLKTDFYRGAILFCMEMRPKVLIPMHFGRHFTLPPEFIKEANNYAQVIMPKNGEIIETDTIIGNDGISEPM